MDVEMKHGLPTVGTGIDHHTVASSVERQLPRDPTDRFHQGVHQPYGTGIESIQGRYVLPRNHQDVFRGLGMDVPEGDADFIFVNPVGLTPPPGNFTEKTIFHQLHLSSGPDPENSNLNSQS